MGMSSKEFVVGDGRTHIDNQLMGASLVRKDLVDSTDTDREVPMMPTMKVVAVGGRSIFDRGRQAVLPLVDELLEAREDHEFVVGCSGGARLRHVYHVALDLGLPTGALSQLAGPSEEQNVCMLQHLMAAHKSCMLKREDFADMPLYLRDGFIPLVISVPPYHYWEPPPKRGGRIPDFGSDFGMYITAEALGAAECVFVKDRDGLYTDDPDLDPNAEFIPEIGAKTLMERDLPSLIIDRAGVETLQHARFVKRVQIINGLKRGLLTRALAGEHVGTIIHRED
jgi:molybdenum storage protein